MGKILWVALLGLWVATFCWMNDFERRQLRNETLDTLRWRAGLDAFEQHASSITELGDLTVEIAGKVYQVQAKV